MPKIHFTKMHGGGNDFIVIDAVRQEIPMRRTVAKWLAHRRLGVGCDQILILRPTKKKLADFQYQIINADGSVVGQCGNGARCAHAFLWREKLTRKRKLLLHTRSTMIMTEGAGDGYVRAHLAVPKFAPSLIPMNINGGSAQPQWYDMREIPMHERFFLSRLWRKLPQKFAAVSLGNPHAVFPWVKRQLGLDDNETGRLLHKFGESLNHQRQLFPQGVNVGFYQLRDGIIHVRVYERGVGETPSCGSGAAAAAVICQCLTGYDKPVKVRMDGGDLICHWPWQENPLAPVWIEGEVNFVFDGKIDL